MAFAVVITARAQRDLDRLPARVIPAVVELMFGELARNPQRVGKPLRRELSGMYGARRGSYRILYRIDVDDAQVVVLRIAHRAEVYRTD